MNVKPGMTIFTSREFNQDTARAKRSAKSGPIFVTDRGEIAYVLMTKQDYDQMNKKPFVSLAEALADNRPEADFDFDFEEFKEPFKGYEFD